MKIEIYKLLLLLVNCIIFTYLHIKTSKDKKEIFDIYFDLGFLIMIAPFLLIEFYKLYYLNLYNVIFFIGYLFLFIIYFIFYLTMIKHKNKLIFLFLVYLALIILLISKFFIIKKYIYFYIFVYLNNIIIYIFSFFLLNDLNKKTVTKKIFYKIFFFVGIIYFAFFYLHYSSLLAKEKVGRKSVDNHLYYLQYLRDYGIKDKIQENFNSNYIISHNYAMLKSKINKYKGKIFRTSSVLIYKIISDKKQSKVIYYDFKDKITVYYILDVTDKTKQLVANLIKQKVNIDNIIYKIYDFEKLNTNYKDKINKYISIDRDKKIYIVKGKLIKTEIGEILKKY